MPEVLLFSAGEETEYTVVFRDKDAPMSILIGRDAECDLTLPKKLTNGDTVSRNHLRFFRSDEEYWIEDLGSKNLTLMDGRVVLFPTRVSLPCKLQLGKVPLRVEQTHLEEDAIDELDRASMAMYHEDSFSALTAAAGELDWRDAMDALGESARWSGALRDVSRLLSHATSREKAERALGRVLEIHLHAKRVHLVVDVPCKKSTQELRGLRLAKRVHSLIGGLTSSHPTFSHSTAAKGQIVWGVRSHHDGEDKAIIAVAHFSDECFADGDTEEAAWLATMALELAAPVLRSLGELKALRAGQLHSVPHAPSKQTITEAKRLGYWGVSRAFNDCLYMAEIAAKIYLKLDSGNSGLKVVCLKGEIGTGKTSLAQLIHAFSSRSRRELVRASIASLVETLAESQFFGIRKEAADSVKRDRPGWFCVADKGTLFIDDIGHLPLSVQKDFLTVLSEGLYTWVGDTASSRTNAHVIAAVNQDLDAMVSEGTFLPDLKSRIEVFEITVPPLRERKEDIRLLVKNHLAGLRKRNTACAITDLSQDLMDALLTYDWPSNIRELVALLEGTVIMAMATPGVTVLDWEHLQPQWLDKLLAPKTRVLRISCDTSLSCDENVEALEREYLAQLLGECDGKFEEVKRRSGKARDTVKKMEGRLRDYLTHAPLEEVDRFRLLAGKGWSRIAPAETS